ncbi:hypothetical protein SMRU11_23945 [Sinorhizobium meliloti RU11/001]|nr:hypothetical protein SMRU11_23945 [Sinorhizobium meliloti RU11/001]
MANAGRDYSPAKMLLNALADLDEGRVPPLLAPAERKAGGLPKPRREIEIDALAVASVDALVGDGMAAWEACEKVAGVVGKTPGAVENLRKKVRSASAGHGKYPAHGAVYDRAQKRITLRGGEDTILKNLAVAVSLLGCK